GGLAIQARLDNPEYFAQDNQKNIYVAESGGGANRVRRIDPEGVISTIAGTGIADSTGDGGPATAARLNVPVSVLLNPQNTHLFIAELIGHRVRKVDLSTGTISPFAGIGTPGFSGDNNPATQAQLNRPAGLAFDSVGNVYISDSVNHRIRKVDPSGNITTFAGTGAPCNPTTATCGDGGPASAAQLRNPDGLLFVPGDHLLIADRSDHRVRSIDLSTNTITTIAGTGTPAYNGDGISATT